MLQPKRFKESDMSTKTEQVCTAFARIADLACALGKIPMSRFENCWEHQIDKHWWIAVNGHKTKKKTSNGVEVSPFNCYVEFNGFPAGIFDPVNGGVIAAGKLANEETFIKAIESQIPKEK